MTGSQILFLIIGLREKITLMEKVITSVIQKFYSFFLLYILKIRKMKQFNKLFACNLTERVLNGVLTYLYLLEFNT